MSLPLSQHQTEIERNLRAWNGKALLRQAYEGFYDRIVALMDTGLPGRIVEVGSGIGNLKSRLPQALSTDLFPNPWLDLTCDAYEMPFRSGTVSHLILFDVFHHLEAPLAFLGEARRVLAPGGRVILFEPYISFASWPAYGVAHHEPVAWGKPVSTAATLARPRAYYAAQGNATRAFFRKPPVFDVPGWNVYHREAFASFSYLLSGGFSRPALYPAGWFDRLRSLDRFLSRWPRCFGARCLVGLRVA